MIYASDWIVNYDKNILTVPSLNNKINDVYDLANSDTDRHDIITIRGFQCVRSSHRLSKRNTPRIRAIKVPGDCSWREIVESG